MKADPNSNATCAPSHALQGAVADCGRKGPTGTRRRSDQQKVETLRVTRVAIPVTPTLRKEVTTMGD